MSQDEVFTILKKLGGKATTSEITDYARINYTDSELYMRVRKGLRKLAGYGLIKRTIVNRVNMWEIVKDYKE